MDSCSRVSSVPGARGCVGYVRCNRCLPVFASLHMTTRSCAKQRRALREKEHMACAVASQSGAWLVSHETLRWGVRSASSSRRPILERRIVQGRPCARAATTAARRQRVAAQWYRAGVRVAIAITSRRAEWGKAPRSTRARRIVQATEALRQRATAPTAHGMAVAVEILGHLKIRRAVRCRRPEDQPATKDQGLWGGMGAHDRCQMGRFIATYGDVGSKRNGHCRAPYDKGEMAKHATPMPQFSTLSTPKCTGVGFTKWTSSVCAAFLSPTVYGRRCTIPQRLMETLVVVKSEVAP